MPAEDFARPRGSTVTLAATRGLIDSWPVGLSQRPPAPGVLLLAVMLAGCLGEPPPVGGGSSSSSSSSTTGTVTTAPVDSTGGVPQGPACIDYLDCLEQVDPPMRPDAEAEYGPMGSCWVDSATAAQCEATCEEQTLLLCPPSGSGGGTGSDPLLCSIEGLAPGSASPVEAGEGAEVLPAEVGDLLERNCGCHYLDAAKLDPRVPAYNGALLMATWQDFHTSFMGQLTYLRVQQRSIVELSMPPVFFCDSLEFGSLDADDYALLSAWLEAGAPDAMQWGR